MAATRGLPSRDWLLACTAILIVALAGRLLFLGSKALWLDEAYSVWFSEQSWHFLWHEVPQFETHPPLYYAILKLWRGLGSGEATLRLLSVLANLATIPLVALTAYTAAPRPHKLPLAVAAGTLFASAPLQLAFAQQARPYALLVLAMSVALASAVWLVVHPQRASCPLLGNLREDRPAIAAYLGLGGGMAMILWMHNLGAIYAAVLGGLLAAWWACQGGRRLPLLGNLLAAALLALALYAPNVPVLLAQVQAVSQNFWLKAPSLEAAWLLMFQVYGQWQVSLRNSVQQYAVQLLIAVPLAVLGVRGLWRLLAGDPERRWAAWLLLGTAFGPTLLMLALTYTAQPVLLDRTMIPVQVSWLLICAAAPLAVSQQRAPLVWGTIFAISFANVAGFVASQSTPERRDAERPWRAIAARIAASDAAGAPVVIVPNDAAVTLSYYDAMQSAGLALHPLPDRYPVRGESYDYPAGGRGVPRMERGVLPRLIEATAGASTVWLITRAEPLFDPTRIVRRALAERFPCAEDTTYELITVTRFDRARAGSGVSACR